MFYYAEFATGDAKSKVAEDAREAYCEATQIAEKNLHEACKMARVAFVVHAVQLVPRVQIQERIVEGPCVARDGENDRSCEAHATGACAE